MPRFEKIAFAGAGGAALAGRLDLPDDGAPRAFALFAHGFTLGKDSLVATRVAQGLADRGIATLRFDFAGIGESGGEFAATTFSSNVEDLLAAAAWLRANREAPALLVGHSFGGAATLAAAARIPEARAIATIGAPADPGHVTHNFAEALQAIAEHGAAEVKLGSRRLTIGRAFVDDLARHDLKAAVATLRRPLLVLHAPRDEIVGIANASAIFAAAKHPKSFVSLDDADHLLTKRADATWVAGLICAWASRALPVRAESPDEAPAAGEVVVRETGGGKFRNEVAVGRHRLRADEPVAAGGDDSGPGPYDYLLAALGACTAMTLRLYAERKGIALARTTVRLRHDRIHAADCAECETKEGQLDRIRRELVVEGDLSAEQRQRLLEIADKCPVHRTLTHEIRIETSLAPSGSLPRAAGEG